MTRNEAIDTLWGLKPELLFVTREQFAAALDGWDIDPREAGGEVAFIWITKGTEVHYVSLGTGRAMPTAMVRDVLQRVIDRHGYATVKTPKQDLRQQRFNRTLGFYQTGEDEYDVHLRMDKFGGKPCQSSL